MRVSKVKVTAATAGALALATSVAVPAQAYSPNPKVKKDYYDTDKCRPLACFDPDPGSGAGTNFNYDKNGVATKMELTYKGKFVGKVEFHPRGEQVCAYDKRDDEDTFYVTVWWIDGNGNGQRAYKTPDPYPCSQNLRIKEGTLVDVAVYDNGYNKDLIGRTVGTA